MHKKGGKLFRDESDLSVLCKTKRYEYSLISAYLLVTDCQSDKDTKYIWGKAQLARASPRPTSLTNFLY